MSESRNDLIAQKKVLEDILSGVEIQGPVDDQTDMIYIVSDLYDAISIKLSEVKTRLLINDITEKILKKPKNLKSQANT